MKLDGGGGGGGGGEGCPSASSVTNAQAGTMLNKERYDAEGKVLAADDQESTHSIKNIYGVWISC